MADGLSDAVMVALTERDSLKERYAHEREIGSFNVASNIYDKIHQRVMLDMGANDGNMADLESYCVCVDKSDLFRASCRILKRFLGSHGVKANEPSE